MYQLVEAIKILAEGLKTVGGILIKLDRRVADLEKRCREYV